MPPKKKSSKKEAEKAATVVASYDALLRFIFLVPDAKQADSTLPFKQYLNTSFNRLLNKVDRDKKNGIDPFPAITTLFKHLMCWDILYRRFKYGIAPSECIFINEKQFINVLEISLAKNSTCVKSLERNKITVVTDKSEKLKYERLFGPIPSDNSVEMISFYSENRISEEYFADDVSNC